MALSHGKVGWAPSRFGFNISCYSRSSCSRPRLRCSPVLMSCPALRCCLVWSRPETRLEKPSQGEAMFYPIRTSVSILSCGRGGSLLTISAHTVSYSVLPVHSPWVRHAPAAFQRAGRSLLLLGQQPLQGEDRSGSHNLVHSHSAKVVKVGSS